MLSDSEGPLLRVAPNSTNGGGRREVGGVGVEYTRTAHESHLIPTGRIRRPWRKGNSRPQALHVKLLGDREAAWRGRLELFFFSFAPMVLAGTRTTATYS